MVRIVLLAFVFIVAVSVVLLLSAGLRYSPLESLPRPSSLQLLPLPPPPPLPDSSQPPSPLSQPLPAVVVVGADTSRDVVPMNLLGVEGHCAPASTLAPPAPLPETVWGTKPKRCPRLFVYAKPTGFGRHHNQLQSMMNTVLWASRLGRTAVLGWFYDRRLQRYVPATELYDFTAMSAHFCIASPDEMRAALGNRTVAIDCFGATLDSTPLNEYVPNGTRCRMQPGVPGWYKVRYATRMTRTFLPRIMAASGDIVLVSAEVAFYMRGGLPRIVTVYRHLHPAAAIAAEVDRFRHARLSDEDFVFHLRMREGTCVKELRWYVEEDERLQALPAAHHTLMRKQCVDPVNYMRCVRRALQLEPGGPMFVASDHQNLQAERQLLAEGAVMYNGSVSTSEASGPHGLIVEFFSMTRGRHFVGNLLSSVSQNACFVRLGRGLSCHGILWSLYEYVTRDLFDEPVVNITGFNHTRTAND